MLVVGTQSGSLVKGHATDGDVEQGRVWLEDKLGNFEADAAADLKGAISLSCLWLLGVSCLMLVIIGIPVCCNFIDS